MTRREQIVQEITSLEKENERICGQLDALKNELSTTLPDLLDRDPDADRDARVKEKNAFLRQEGLIP